ncbi:hypothetical protein CYY_008159 [Polysphondylium violaceum]|uniref:PNPLA domain-containing protein n=1 Tax=Polysphondylium violaceum TaxID=133409 RepID=A0A8J4PM27_9MYCE|nr:hypothetical protein CYY_008159 [Polysphondylium violaceum]
MTKIKKEKSHYRILSLDGGGVRSIIETVLLKKIIEVFPTFLDNVDLITGASAGGILALELASGKTNEEASEFFKKIVPDIFHKSWYHEFTSLDSAIAPAYTNEKLKEVLQTQFGDMTLKDLPKKILIPAFQLDNHSSSVPEMPDSEKIDADEEYCDEEDQDFEIIPNPHHRKNADGPVTHHRRWAPRFFHNLQSSKTNEHLCVDVALRTSAAPTYFPIYQGFVDGGVYANNPSLCAVTSAISSGIGIENIVVLSLSTGRDGKFVSPDQYGAGNWGLAQWAPTLINMLLDSNVEITDFQCAQLLGTRYHRVDPLLTQNIDLDQPKFIPLLEEIANAVDLTLTFEWVEKFWFKKGDHIRPIFTPTTSPSYTSPILRPRVPKSSQDDDDEEGDNITDTNKENMNASIEVDTTIVTTTSAKSGNDTIDSTTTTTTTSTYTYRSCSIQ